MKAAVIVGADVYLLGVLDANFFVFFFYWKHFYIHLFGKQNDVWAPMHAESVNEALVRLAFMSHQASP